MPTIALILVHGTFAAADDDVGERWWQRGSGFWTGIHAGLGLHSPETSPSFHWSGDNSKAERKQAGLRLASLLETLEAAKRPYHLVGHSHGGSVIWHALLELTRRSQSLSCLRSWATVGTPFFKYAPRPISIWQLATILVVVSLLVASAGHAIEFGKHAGTFIDEQTLGVSLLPVLIASAWLVSGIMIVELIARYLLPRRSHEATTAASYSAGGRSALVRGAFIVLTAATGLLALWWFDRTSAGPLTIGKVAQSLRGLKVAVIPLIWIALSAVLVALISRLTVQLTTHLRLRTEREVEARTARLAMPRYLSLWSRSDEAINGLRTTLATPGHVVPRLRLLGPMRTQFILALLSAPFRWLYNDLFARAGDEYVSFTACRAMMTLASCCSM